MRLESRMPRMIQSRAKLVARSRTRRCWRSMPTCSRFAATQTHLSISLGLLCTPHSRNCISGATTGIGRQKASVPP